MWGVAGGERLRRTRMDPGSEKLYTTAQVADMLGLNARSVRAAIGRGQIRAIAVTPRLNLVPASEVERYRLEHLSGPGRPGRPRKHDDD